MYEQLLEHYRARANMLISQARSSAERQRIARDNAECVLRNRAKLLVCRLDNVGTEFGRTKILQEAFRGS
jgi:hypothetical protein